MFHGGNTWPYDRHRFAATRFSVERTLIQERREELMQAISKANVGIDSLQIMDGGGVLWRDGQFSLRRVLSRTMRLGTRLVPSRNSMPN